MTIWHLIIFVAVLAVLQVWLSTRKPNWPGLVPGVGFFLFTVVLMFLNGIDPSVSFWTNVGIRVLYLLLFNLPTAVMLFYHFWSRSPRRRYNQEAEQKRREAAEAAARPAAYAGPKPKKKKSKKKK